MNKTADNSHEPIHNTRTTHLVDRMKHWREERERGSERDVREKDGESEREIGEVLTTDSAKVSNHCF